MVVKRFDVFLVCLDPTVGAEMKKTRPCLVISPDEMNRQIRTVTIAPMTSRGRPYPTRVACTFQRKQGQVVLDQIRTVDASRLVKKLGRADPATQSHVLQVLAELFAP
jgi:mRNA interferase MazF